jgi:hypothetical protein
MLAELYNWFTEGFDTANLKDAKALLDELRLSRIRPAVDDFRRRRASISGRVTSGW